jgi:hypothetical protein
MKIIRKSCIDDLHNLMINGVKNAICHKILIIVLLGNITPFNISNADFHSIKNN